MRPGFIFSLRDLSQLAIEEASRAQPLGDDRHYMARPSFDNDGDLNGIFVTECDCEDGGEGDVDLSKVAAEIAERMRADGIDPGTMTSARAVNLQTGEETDITEMLAQHGKPKH